MGRRPAARFGAVPALLAACCAAVLLWDGRAREERMVDARPELSALRAALGSGRGDVLWVDGASETWFLARRPSFFNAVQGAPILFSRDLALEWSDRGRLLRGLGLARAADVAPWGAGGGSPAADDIRFTPEAASRFCADRRHPAALVVPGEQLDRVPPGWTSSLWRPPFAIHHPSIDGNGATWSSVAAFTVVPCPTP